MNLCPTSEERQMFLEYLEKWAENGREELTFKKDAPEDVKIFVRTYVKKYLDLM